MDEYRTFTADMVAVLGLLLSNYRNLSGSCRRKERAFILAWVRECRLRRDIGSGARSIIPF